MVYITSLAVKMLDKATSYKFYIHYYVFLQIQAGGQNYSDKEVEI